ncbi:MAG TPA: hypothetical protein VGI97_04615 [Gemmatimonadaceae bacterium]|jgi:hypothetical protein
MTTPPVAATPDQPDTTRFIATIVASAAGIVIGLLWDISWHMTVGRDSFWTPPHVLEYVSAICAGVTCGAVVLRTTFGSRSSAATVRFWGFRGPIGAWITIWGTFAMLASAPFDNWWHNAYGLDVKIVSPPHMVLFWGMLGIVVGALALTASAQNSSAQRNSVRDAWLYACAGGIVAFVFTCGTLEYSWPNEQHSATFYVMWAGVFPLLLAGYSRAGRLAFPAAAAALVSMLLWFVMGQILPHVAAVPRLAPVWNPRTYLWPPYFPVMLVVPALGMDLVRRRLSAINPWLLSLALGVTFVALLCAVQWPVSSFMVHGNSQTWLLHGHEWPYSTRPGPWQTRFWGSERSAVGMDDPSFLPLVPWLCLAAIGGTIASRIGLAWGEWMSRVRR